MFGLTIWHWVLLFVVVVLIFGSGRVSKVLSDLGRGVGAFRKGIEEGHDPPDKPPS